MMMLPIDRSKISQAREVLQKLLAKYNQHFKDDATLLSNEKEACKDLIIPLIRDLLHWNTEDPSEFKTEVSQNGKRVDYVVSNQGISQFIVEAKAPSKNIFDNPEAYQQAISYGYNKDHDFAILTNFRQIVILAPKKQFRVPGEAEIGRIDMTSADDKKLELLLCFEKEFWIDTKAKENPLYSLLGSYKPQIPVNDKLLDDMRHWREVLLTNIQKNKQNNFDSGDEQEFMHVEEEVQRFIDRFVFICFCEDKELHEPKLKELTHDKKFRFALKQGYLLEKIRELFSDFKKAYNSDLFDKGDCDNFQIDDDKLLDILEGLRMPKGRVAYDFKTIESDILGRVYENFIGHVTTGKKQFGEKEDIGKRKKGGVYYTPKYIVDYIVNNTVRGYIKGKSFEEISKVRILDPACGSGSFLLRAFDVFVEESEKSLKHELSYDEKKNLMLNCIFGVDIDERAREIAKLNLSLKLAERNKPLPRLRDNIRLGNSLIDDKNLAGYKAFVWEKEFPEIVSQGGFNIVIGNPPWGADIDNILEFLKNAYPNSTKEHKDIYKCFIEKGITLLRTNGILGFIVPNTCLLQPRYKDVRLFLKSYTLLYIINLGEKVFVGVDAPSCILIVRKRNDNKENKVKVLDLAYSKDNFYKSKILSNPDPYYIELSQSIYDKTVDNNFVTFYRELEKNELTVETVMDCKDCGIKYQRVGVGMKEKGKNDLRERLFYESDKKAKDDMPYIIGADLNRYSIKYPNRFMKYNYKELLKKNEIVYFNKTYFDYPEKILWRQTADRPVCCICAQYWFANTLQVGIIRDYYKDKLSIKYLLGLFNSKYFTFLYIQSVRELGRVFPQVKLNKIKQLPIKIIPLNEQGKIMKLVDKMLSLNKRLNEIGDKKTSETTKIEEEIKRTDKEIDELVYKLYGITEEEKKIIEEALQ